MKVFVTRKIPDAGLEILRDKYDVTVSDKDRPLEKDEIIEGVRDSDAVLCLLHDQIDAEMMDAGSDLKIISNYAVGYDNIDVKAATERGIAVTNTPGVLTEATAEITWALMMAVSRRIVQGDKFVRKDRFLGWDPGLMVGHELSGKALGIIGMGSIGMAVARLSTGFDMDILYHSRSRNKEAEEKYGAKKVELQELLRDSDFVSLHVPLNEETKEMISWKEMDVMKSTAYLINAARGEVVNEEALIEALRSGKIAGAGVDVYSDEPRGANPDYYDLNNVVLAPHLGSATFRAREGMAVMAAENIVAMLEDNKPEYIVNPEIMN